MNQSIQLMECHKGSDRCSGVVQCGSYVSPEGCFQLSIEKKSASCFVRRLYCPVIFG